MAKQAESTPHAQPEETAASLAWSTRWTLGRKLMVVVASSIVVGYAALIAVQIHSLSVEVHELAVSKDMHISRLLAAQVAGGVRWQKPEAIERAYGTLVRDPTAPLEAVTAWDVRGEILTSFRADQADATDLAASLKPAAATLDRSEIYAVEAADHLIVLLPVLAGEDGEYRVGTLGLAWGLEGLRDLAFQQLTRQTALGFTVLFTLLPALLYLLYLLASLPLRAVTEATLRIAGGDTRTEVPFTQRRDEIGDMARSLEVFKKNLATIHSLSAEQRAQSRMLAEALEKERSYTNLQREFVSMASHEFRTPLTIIDGAAQRVERGLDRLEPKDVKEKIRKIRNAVSRMITLIESVLSSASFDSGKFKVQVAPCDLKEIVGSVCRREQEISSSHEIVTDLSQLPSEIVGDPRLLEQVFTNLLSNAVKYSPGSPKVTVVGRASGSEALVCVTDYGVGIPPAEQAKIFDRYYRASTSTGIAGTGIGLNLVAQAVELHGGKVELESGVGLGTTFTVRLPVRTLSAGRDSQPACPEISFDARSSAA